MILFKGYSAIALSAMLTLVFCDTLEEIEKNRLRALSLLIGHSAFGTSKLIVMKPTKGELGLLDLARVDDTDSLPETDGLITTDPNIVLSANTADCNMIAMYGHGNHGLVLGLIHISRYMADKGGHTQAFGYMSETYGLSPGTTRMIFAPSIKAESYKFPDISEAQKSDPRWRDYIYKDKAGPWHVNTTRKIVEELQDEGVQSENMYLNPIDMGSDPNFFFSSPTCGARPRARW